MAGAAIVPIALGDSAPDWTSIADAPESRQEVSYTAAGGHLYLAAGNERDQDRYDPASDNWDEVAALPAAFEDLDHVHGVEVNGRIVYAGGLEQWELPFPVSSAVAIYDPAGDEFTAGDPMPSARAAGGVAAWHGWLIYAGGLGPGGSVARVDAYNPESDEWTSLADMPRPRDHFQAAVVGDHLYAIGGRETVDDGGHIEVEDIAEIDVLDISAGPGGDPDGTWSTLPEPIPTPRGGLGVVAVGECIYAVGGEYEGAGANGVTGATESLDTRTGVWHELPPLQLPRHGIQAAALGKQIYIAGGGTKAFDSEPTAAHDRLDVEAAGPCATTDPPPSPIDAGEPPTPAIAQAPLKIRHLAVRPRRLRLHRRGIRPRRPVIVAVASRAGRVVVRLPRRYRFKKRLRAGRNVLRLPLRARRRSLPPGRYKLRARVPGSRGPGSRAAAGFRILR